ncbi:MAG TPA: AraC family transcriptional regulator [Oceanospirillales bacterium]|nr:AraC family transcriptional regulator [Oceanospirillales bacterium]
MQGLKKSVVDLNKDLQLMEEELLFPSSTQLSLFVSLDIGQYFTLESVKVKLDGKQVVTHLYSERQRQALARGGVQRLYLTNLNLGKHTIVAFFTGIGPNGRPYKRATELEFQKKQGSQYLELAIIDDSAKQEAKFTIKQW